MGRKMHSIIFRLLPAVIALNLFVSCAESHDQSPVIDLPIGTELSPDPAVSVIRLAARKQSTRSDGYSNPSTGTGSLGTAAMVLAPDHYDFSMNEAMKFNQLYPFHFNWSVAGETKADRFDKLREFLSNELAIDVDVHEVPRDGYELYVLNEGLLNRYADESVREQHDHFTNTGIQYTGYTLDALAKAFSYDGGFACKNAVPSEVTYSFHLIDHGGFDPENALAISLRPLGLALRPARVPQMVVHVSGEGIVEPNIGEFPQIEVLGSDGEPGGFGGTEARIKQE